VVLAAVVVSKEMVVMQTIYHHGKDMTVVQDQKVRMSAQAVEEREKSDMVLLMRLVAKAA
jgi:hypothetical protein